MEITIIAIGDELLLGQVTDTNSGFIARQIAPEGWSVREVMVVADNADEITTAIDTAFNHSRIVITTGGLGPTKDDITKEALRGYFGGEMEFRPDVLENVKAIFGRRGLPLNRLTEGQAMVPTSADVIQNECGTAPIMWFEDQIRERVLVAMPGVPHETETMFVKAVFPRLLEKFNDLHASTHHTLMVDGISESALAERLSHWEESLPEQFHLAYLPQQGIIRLRLDGHGIDRHRLEKETAIKVDELKRLCGDNLLYDGDSTPAEILLTTAISRGLTVGCAESCTGGKIAHLITSIAGSSRAMMGGVVSYSNEAKINILGVNAEDIDRHGAVSLPVVEQMAEGACRALGCDIAMATSGIAGPGGGSEEKPVGTVCIAVAISGRIVSHTYHFAGSRRQVIDRAATTALVMTIRELQDVE